MVYIHSTSAPAKNTKECVVGHVSCDATQGCTFETAFGVGGMSGQQTSHGTSQQEAFHWRFPIGYRVCPRFGNRIRPAHAQHGRIRTGLHHREAYAAAGRA